MVKLAWGHKQAKVLRVLFFVIAIAWLVGFALYFAYVFGGYQ